MALREMLLRLGVEVDKNAEAKALSTLDKVKAAAKIAAVAVAAIKGVQAIAGVVEGIREIGDEIDKTSRQLGIGKEALQEFRFAAQLSGVGATEMSNALQKLQKNAFEAATGNKEYADTFKLLGINVKDTNGNVKTGDMLLTEMADSMQKLQPESARVGVAMQLMGRSGAKLIPLFEEGSAGIEKMRQEARELGGVLDEELVAQTAQLTDDQARLDQTFRGLKITLTAAVIPTVIELTQAAFQLVRELRGPLRASLTFIGRIFRATTTYVRFMSEQFGFIGVGIVALTAGLSLLGTTFLLVGKQATIAGIKTAASWVIASAPLLLIVALFGIIIGTILLVIEDLVAMGEGGESVFGTLIEGFGNLIDEAGGVGAAFIDIFKTAYEFWKQGAIDAFGIIAETAFQTVEDILAMWKRPFELISSGLSKISGFFGGETPALARAGAGAGPLAGPVTTALPVPNGVPGNSFSNRQNTSVQVSVDAQGQQDPQAIGNMVAQQVDAAMQRRDRQTMQAFADASGT